MDPNESLKLCGRIAFFLEELRNLPTLLGLLAVWNASCMGYEAGKAANGYQSSFGAPCVKTP